MDMGTSHFHEDIIKELRSYLKGRFGPRNVLDDISIGETDRQQIIQDLENHGPSIASSNMLDILLRYPSDIFIEFTKALCKHGREDLAQYIKPKVPEQYKNKFSFVPVQDPSSNLEGAVGGETPHRSVSFPDDIQPGQRDHGLQHSQSAPLMTQAELSRIIVRLLSGVSIEDNRAYPEPQETPLSKMIQEQREELIMVLENNADNSTVVKKLQRRHYNRVKETPLSEMIQEQSEEMIMVLENNADYSTVVKKLQRRHYNKVKDFKSFTMLLEELEGRGWTVKKLVDEIVMNLDQQLRNQILIILKYPIPSDRNVVYQDLPNIPSVPQVAAFTQSASAQVLSRTQQCQNDQGSFNAHKGPGVEAELMHQDALTEGNGCLTTVGLPIQSEADIHSERSSKPTGLEAERSREDTLAASSESQLTRSEGGHVNLRQSDAQLTRTEGGHVNLRQSEARFQLPYVSSSSVASTSGENREQLQSSETHFDSEAVNLDSFSQNEITIPKILYEENTDQNKAQSDVSHGIDQLDDDHPGEDQSDDCPGEDQSDDCPGEDQSDDNPDEDESDDSSDEDDINSDNRVLQLAGGFAGIIKDNNLNSGINKLAENLVEIIEDDDYGIKQLAGDVFRLFKK